MSEENMLLGNRYEIGRLLGRGGMAEVYLAHDKRLNRTVAVKVLRSDLAQDEHFQERFRREAQAAASLNHPAIVGVHDTGEDHRTEANGEDVTIPYIVMEYVEGETLRGSISEEHPMGEKQASRIMQGVLSALERSHRAGIVHRDIKPGNVMITDRGEVKVMDFGIARAIAEATSAMTQTQSVMGTAQYLSPEQARGQQVDARSDVYSAAVVLYELLTGRPPFTGDSPVSIAYQHVRETPPPPSTFNPGISQGMDAVVLKGLAKDVNHRYQSAAEFAADISTAADGGQPHALAAGFGAGAAEAATQQFTADDYPTEAMEAQNTQLIPTQTAPIAAGAAATGAAAGSAPAADAGNGSEVATDEEEEKDRGKVLAWILALLALVAVAATAWWLLAGRDNGVDQVAVPAIVGATQDEARSKLDQAGLKAEFTEEPSKDVDEGSVISSDPTEGTMVDPGSTVSVAVSSGPSAVQLPDLVGMSEDEARAAVEKLGLTLTVVGTEDIPDVAKDHVGRMEPASGEAVTEGSAVRVWLSSGKIEVPKLVGLSESAAKELIEDTDGLEYKISYKVQEGQTVGSVLEQTPAEGDMVDPGTVINLIVNAEPGPTTVPNLTGQPKADAEAALAEAGFGFTTRQEYSDTVEAGRVITTDPGPNAEVDQGATITLVVSRGPQPTTEPPTTTPAPTTEAPSPGPTTQEPEPEEDSPDATDDAAADTDAGPGIGKTGNGVSNGNGKPPAHAGKPGGRGNGNGND